MPYTRTVKSSDVARLEEIKDEMKALLGEAMEIVRGTSEWERAKAYTFSNLACHLDDDHMYLGRFTTLADVTESLKEQLECEDEEGEEVEA